MLDLMRKPGALPKLVGHRGACDVAPENTLASFQRALDDGVDIVELDVRLSADGYVVVFHDEMVDRTTDGNGIVGGLTLAELQKLDAGSWFDARFAGERIPTLDAVFDLVRDKCAVFIELKYGYKYPLFDPDLVPAVIESILRFDMLEQAAFISYTAPALRQSKSLLPGLAVGPMMFYNRYILRLAGLVKRFPWLQRIPHLNRWLLSPLTSTLVNGGDFVCPSIEVVTPTLVEAAHAVNMAVSPGGWRWDYPEAITMGIDTVSSNNPGQVRKQHL